MPASKVLKADCSAGDSYARKNITVTAPWKVQCDILLTSNLFTALAAVESCAEQLRVLTAHNDGAFVTSIHTDGSGDAFGSGPKNWWTDQAPGNPAASFTQVDTWLRSVVVHFDGTTVTWSF